MDVTKARQVNLWALIEKHGTIERLAELAPPTAPGHLSQINNATRGMGAKVARRFEKKLGLPDGWMDRDHGHDLDADALMIARQWHALNEPQREFVQAQLRLAMTLNFGHVNEGEER